MNSSKLGLSLLALLGVLGAAPGSADLLTVDYTIDAGGSSTGPLNGLAARATFELNETTLLILVENTSTGVPAGFELSDSLLVSLAFSLPEQYAFVAGRSSIFGPGSVGLGRWAGWAPGASVADEWLWGNDGAGDRLQDYRQVITTSNGLGGAPAFHFYGGSGNVSGPFGGIAAAPPVVGPFNGNTYAVSDTIQFTMELNAPITRQQLELAAEGSIVEFGSDVRYLTPEPATLVMASALGLWALRRRGPQA